jgi:hypothetical protein
MVLCALIKYARFAPVLRGRDWNLKSHSNSFYPDTSFDSGRVHEGFIVTSTKRLSLSTTSIFRREKIQTREEIVGLLCAPR